MQPTAAKDGCECIAGSHAAWNPNEALLVQECVACEPGHVWVPDATSSGKEGVCTPCAAGMTLLESPPYNCIPCLPGTSSQEAGLCTRCGVGLYAPTWGSGACGACNYSLGLVASADRLSCVAASSMCSAPNPAYYDAATETCRICTTCSAAQFQQRACSALQDTVCQNCTVCRVGGTPMTSECSASTDRTCGTCTPGTYLAGTGTACVQCPLGTYSSDSGRSACLFCVPDTSGVNTTMANASQSIRTWPSTDRTGCVHRCERGSYLKSGIQAPGCQVCPAGTYEPGMYCSIHD